MSDRDPARPARGSRRIPPPAGIRGAFTLKPAPLPWRKAAGVAATTTLVFAAGVATHHFAWSVMGFLGGFTAFYVDPLLPYRERVRLLAGVALGLLLAVGLASLAAPNWILTTAALTAVAAGATFGATAARLPLPGAFMFVLAACITAALPPAPATTPIRLLGVAAGAVLAIGFGTVGGLVHPDRPARRAVAELLDRLAHLAEVWPTPHREQAETEAGDALRAAQRAVAPFARRGAGPSPAHRLVLLTHQAERFFECLAGQPTNAASPLPPDAPVRLRALARAVRTHTPPPRGVVYTGAPRPLGRMLASFERTLIAHVALVHGPPPVERRRPWLWLRDALTPDALVVPATLRIGLAVAVGCVLSHALGNPHPYWVPLTVAAVLQGPSVASMAVRAVDRAVGTVLGLGLAAVLAPHAFPGLATVALIVLLQALLVLTVVVNYGLAVVFITALALVIIHAGKPVPVGALLGARLADTLMGVGIGLVAALTLFRHAASSRLPEALGATLRREAALAAAISRADAVAQARDAVEVALLRERRLFFQALEELPPPPALNRFWPVLLAVERVGFRLSALEPDVPLSPDLAAVLDRWAEVPMRPEQAPAFRPLPPLPSVLVPAVQDLRRALGRVVTSGSRSGTAPDML